MIVVCSVIIELHVTQNIVAAADEEPEQKCEVCFASFSGFT